MFIAVVVAAGVVVLWLAMDWLDAYVSRSGELEAMPRAETITTLVRLLKAVAIALAASMIPLSAFLVWYARRCIETGSMPPTGSTIVEGQRIRTGVDAIRAARLLLWLTTALALVVVAAAVYFWWIAIQLEINGTLS